jgi:hypothetical protein
MLIIVAVAAISIYPIYMLINPPDTVHSVYDEYQIEFYGDGISTPKNITYEELFYGTFTQYEVTITTVNSYGTENTNITKGVRLLDVINRLGLSMESATGFQFRGEWNYLGPYLPFSLLKEDPSQVLLVNTIDGVILTNSSTGGFGPIRSYVNRSLQERIANDAYSTKNLYGVQFVTYPNCNLTIFGSGILEKNVTITYGYLKTAKSSSVGRLTNAIYNWTDGIEEHTDELTGCQLYTIFLNLTGILNDVTWSECRFVNSTGHVSDWIFKSEVNFLDRNQIMVVYQLNGADLTTGCLMSAVNSTIRNPNSAYYLTDLTGIELAIH